MKCNVAAAASAKTVGIIAQAVAGVARLLENDRDQCIESSLSSYTLHSSSRLFHTHSLNRIIVTTQNMASPLVVGLGLLGAGLAGRVGYQMMRASRGGAQEFLKGGFKAKMDRSEAIQILGLR